MLYLKEQKFEEALVCIEEAEEHHPNVEEIQDIKLQVELFQKQFKSLKKK